MAAIPTDLARSPFQGEGHRKVHARRRILDGIRVSRTRVLRVMRVQGLLSPHRGRQGNPKAHDGTIVTSAPQVMWGTDGVRVFTVEDGWVWTFAAVDHWNVECVGWHVCKVGSRFAAFEPIAQGLGRRYGSVSGAVPGAHTGGRPAGPAARRGPACARGGPICEQASKADLDYKAFLAQALAQDLGGEGDRSTATGASTGSSDDTGCRRDNSRQCQRRLSITRGRADRERAAPTPAARAPLPRR